MAPILVNTFEKIHPLETFYILRVMTVIGVVHADQIWTERALSGKNPTSSVPDL